MKTFCRLLWTAVISMALMGCQKDIEPDVVYELTYANKTEYEVTVTLHGVHFHPDTVSLVIPSNSEGSVCCYENFGMDRCTMLFEDGRSVVYTETSDMNNGNPLWYFAYNVVRADEEKPKSGIRMLCSFDITEDNYNSAQPVVVN